MRKQLLYEYAVIRVVPRVEREEFINAGLVLFCKEKNILYCRIHLDESKLCCLDPNMDIGWLKKNLNAFEEIALGKNRKTKISGLDLPSRFRWLTATRSTIIQSSKVHIGFSEDLESSFERLFQQLVATPIAQEKKLHPEGGT